MLQKPWFSSFRTAMLSLVAIFLAAALSCCSSDDEPGSGGKPSPSSDYNKVTINADGTASGGAVFSRIDDTTFYLDYVKYKIVDSHLEIIGYDPVELPAEPKLYAEVKLNGTILITRKIAGDYYYGGAFKKANMKTLTVPSTIIEYGTYCFQECASLESVNLPKNLTYMGEGWFDGCSSLKNIKIPDGVTSIGNNCFRGCSSLKEINIPSGVTSIGRCAFYKCSSISEIILPDKIETISEYCFGECSTLSKVTLPSNLRSLTQWILFHCTQLKSITFKSNVPYYGAGLYDMGCKPIAYVPMEFLEEYQTSWVSNYFSEIIGY